MGRPIGIDLGTTYSTVASVDEDGKPRLLTNVEGLSLVPSVVLFEDTEVLVGDIAKDSTVAMPERVVSCIKRCMGNPDWTFGFGGKMYRPEDISSFILKELKSIAQRHLGPVTEAVITVPAYFMDAERQATVAAAELAGLKVLKIIDEPTAAALAYKLMEEKRDSVFLVYDLGGGTFDVTVMRAAGGSDFEMLNTQGNHRLGGTDWDAAIRDHVAERFQAQHNRDPREDSLINNDLLTKAERAKISLSQVESSRIVCQYEGISATTTLTRSEFEELTAGLLALTEAETDLALQGAGLTSDQIDVVLLVGGSSKMPMVQRLMATKARSLRTSANPDHCVALGAAIEAARIVAQKSTATGLFKQDVRNDLCRIRVMERTPHSLGLVAVERGALRNAIIIPKNSNVPCTRSRDDFTTSRDNQETLTVHLVQGESEDPLGCTPLASYDFQGIPLRPKGAGRIRIEFRFNKNTIVEVSATDIESGCSLAQSVQPLVEMNALIEEIGGGKGKKQVRPRVAVLLMDCSGSMSGREMEDAKQAALDFIRKTDFKRVRMGLVQFGMNSRASVLHQISDNSSSIKAAVGALEADGGTPMAEAIECGMALLGQEPPVVENFMVLFTDGLPNNPDATRHSAKQAKDVGITIMCASIPGADQRLLDEIKSADGGSFFAESSTELGAIFGNMAEIISGKQLEGKG